MTPPVTIPLTVCARNEARSIGACLDSLLAARAYAEARLPVRLELLVVLDDCTDATAERVRERGVALCESRGGKGDWRRTRVCQPKGKHI